MNGQNSRDENDTETFELIFGSNIHLSLLTAFTSIERHVGM